MATQDTFAALMARLRAGEDAAAREVFERFAGRLIGLARGQFNQLLARKVDPEDVVQSAYKSFFVRHRAGKLGLGTALLNAGDLARATGRPGQPSQGQWWRAR